MKQAIIVAAGKSSRLYPRTLDCPKGLLEINGKPILQTSIDQIKKCGIEKVSIVTGYMHDVFPKRLKSVDRFIVNPFYGQCNNLGSLWIAKPYVLEEPLLYLHGDIVYDINILKQSIEKMENSDAELGLVVDFKKSDDEAMKVEIDPNGKFISSSKQIPLDRAAGEWIGIALFRRPSHIFKQFEEDLLAGDLQNYDTYSFTNFSNKNNEVICISTEQKNWIEIDFESDFIQAKKLFSK